MKVKNGNLGSHIADKLLIALFLADILKCCTSFVGQFFFCFELLTFADKFSEQQGETVKVLVSWQDRKSDHFFLHVCLLNKQNEVYLPVFGRAVSILIRN